MSGHDSARIEREKRIASLAREIAEGKKERLPELWDEMKPLCAWFCRRLYFGFSPSAMMEYGDMYNCGYIALCETVKRIKPGDCEGLSRLYLYRLMGVIYRENGLDKGGRDENGRRRFDPSISKDSLRLDAGVRSEDGTFSSVLDSLPSDAGNDAQGSSIEAVEEGIFLRQLHDALETLIEKLPRDERILIRRKYYADANNAQVAARLNITPAEAARLEDRALLRLRKYGQAVSLEQFLDSRTNYYSGTGLSCYRNSGSGSPERLTIMRAELEEKLKQTLS